MIKNSKTNKQTKSLFTNTVIPCHRQAHSRIGMSYYSPIYTDKISALEPQGLAFYKNLAWVKIIFKPLTIMPKDISFKFLAKGCILG